MDYIALEACRVLFMSHPSNWPLPPQSYRHLVAPHSLKAVQQNPVGRHLNMSALGYYHRALGHAMQRENPDDWLLILCVGGRGQFRLNRGWQAVTAGDLMLLPPQARHAYRSDTREPWSIYWLHFQGELAASLCDLLPPRQTLSEPEAMIALFERLSRCVSVNASTRAWLHAGSLLQSLLTFAAMDAESRREEDPGKMPELEAVRQFMRKRLETGLTLAELSAQFGISRFHLVRWFRARTGLPPMEYFIRLRIEKACLLLDRSNQPVHEVARECGYADPYYFSRIFRKTMGLSPLHYRKGRAAGGGQGA